MSETVVDEAVQTKTNRIARARDLRQDSTRAERILWSIVRNRKLEGFKFRRQVPIDRYFADFACIEAKLVVELDGGQHGDQIAYDEERTRVLERCGFRVIRFWNSSVVLARDGVVRRLLSELRPLECDNLDQP